MTGTFAYSPACGRVFINVFGKNSFKYRPGKVPTFHLAVFDLNAVMALASYRDGQAA